MKEILNSNDYMLDDNDYYIFEQDLDSLFESIFKKGFIIVIEASNIDWRGRGGITIADSLDKLKRIIIDGNHFESTTIYATDKNKLLKIVSSGHDVPTGCSMNCYALTKKNSEKYDITKIIPENKIRPIIYDENKYCFKVSHLSAEKFNKRRNK